MCRIPLTRRAFALPSRSSVPQWPDEPPPADEWGRAPSGSMANHLGESHSQCLLNFYMFRQWRCGQVLVTRRSEPQYPRNLLLPPNTHSPPVSLCAPGTISPCCSDFSPSLHLSVIQAGQRIDASLMGWCPAVIAHLCAWHPLMPGSVQLTSFIRIFG